jgi:ubiquinone/menaquinone biosynthesis C-methylase UbiE
VAPEVSVSDDPFHGDAVAAAWERHRARVFEAARPVSDWLVEHVDAAPGATVLELTAGPGETGFLVAERVGPTGRVLSTDVAPGMVAAAQRGVEARGLTNVECQVMDAQQLDLDDHSVDGVLSRFGVMLTPEPERVVRESRRVLRPGRAVAYAVWGMPDRNPWLFTLVAALMQCGHTIDADPFGPGGVFSLAEPERNRALLEDAGFTGVVVEELTGVMAYDSAADYWDVQGSLAGPVAELIASLSPQEVAAVHDAIAVLFEPHRAGAGFELPWQALVATGTA